MVCGKLEAACHEWNHYVHKPLSAGFIQQTLDFLQNKFCMKRNLSTLFCIPILFLISCEMNVVELPCIFGKWKVRQLYAQDGAEIDSVRLSPNLLITPGLKIDFQKSDKAYFSLPQSVALDFKYSDKGFRFFTDSGEIQAKDISVENDTMTMRINGNQLVFTRLLSGPAVQ